MNKNTGIIVGIIVLVVIVGGAYASMSNKDKMTEEKIMMDEKNQTMNEVAEKSEAMMAGYYETYTPEKLIRAKTGSVVLFFNASWCPSCRGLNADIEANMGAIPEGVSILKVDYDKETELKKKYGVTYQHTLVQVDAEGTLIKKWSGSPTLSGLVSEIK